MGRDKYTAVVLVDKRVGAARGRIKTNGKIRSLRETTQKYNYRKNHAYDLYSIRFFFFN